MVLLLVSWVCYRKLHPPGHAATDTLVPGYSKGAPRKTTPHPDRTLLRMACEDHFISARGLTAWMRTLYGMRAARKAIINRLLPHGYHAY